MLLCLCGFVTELDGFNYEQLKHDLRMNAGPKPIFGAIDSGAYDVHNET